MQSTGNQAQTPTRRTPRERCRLRRTPLCSCGTWTAPAAWSGSGSTCAAVLAPEAYSATNTFSYTRDDDRFEQVMAYFWVNQAQE